MNIKETRSYFLNRTRARATLANYSTAALERATAKLPGSSTQGFAAAAFNKLSKCGGERFCASWLGKGEERES